ncbi:hypothetical protein CC117_12560 [Parafrankia colletiae]|uniref:ADP-ribosylglycohydrolase n=2 Tax=Parafrankia colletiae TaxID=573497 RepID=A0A1S1R9B2_9ACTN|nr:hypothetical protein [Frankia sp. Cpl3]OHV42381.1 hypothetical protein CC117_12560 [Parafrankia colletiae]
MVCGSLLGAVYGEHVLPTDWLAALEGTDLIGELADDIVRELVDPPTEPDAWGGAITEWFDRYPGS